MTLFSSVSAEIDHALKQLLLESMELTEVNATGEVVPATLPPALIPWDSPYFYFKGITVADETELEEDRPPSVVRVVDTEAEDKDNGKKFFVETRRKDKRVSGYSMS